MYSVARCSLRTCILIRMERLVRKKLAKLFSSEGEKYFDGQVDGIHFTLVGFMETPRQRRIRVKLTPVSVRVSPAAAGRTLTRPIRGLGLATRAGHRCARRAQAVIYSLSPTAMSLATLTGAGMSLCQHATSDGDAHAYMYRSSSCSPTSYWCLRLVAFEVELDGFSRFDSTPSIARITTSVGRAPVFDNVCR